MAGCDSSGSTFRDRTTGRYRYLVELGGRQQHASAGVVELAVALATRLPYRQATHLLSRLLGDPVDHRSLYSWVRAEGQAVVDEEGALQDDVFGAGVIPPSDGRARELVVAVVDGTYLKAQREPQPSFEVRIGVAYSGRSLQSRTARHRRYHLDERQLYGDVETARDFAERFYLACEEKLALSRARHRLVIGDGADWIETLAGHERYRAAYQLDHWHLIEHARRTFPDRPALVHGSPQRPFGHTRRIEPTAASNVGVAPRGVLVAAAGIPAAHRLCQGCPHRCGKPRAEPPRHKGHARLDRDRL